MASTSSDPWAVRPARSHLSLTAATCMPVPRSTLASAFSSVARPSATSVIPGVTGSRKNRFRCGRRRSRSTRATRRPPRASATARLAAVVDLPSFGYRTGEEDRARLAGDQRELEIGPQHSKRLAVLPRRIGQHHQLVRRCELPRRLGNPGEQRQAELLGYLGSRADTGIERLDQEHQACPRHEAEEDAECGGTLGPGCHLISTCRCPHDRYSRCLKCLERLELLILLHQLAVQDGVLLATGKQLHRACGRPVFGRSRRRSLPARSCT